MNARKPITAENALLRLETQCARSEMSTGEALKKLRTWGVRDSDARQIVATLVKSRYIDDLRFSHAFVRDKIRFAHWGRRKILISLISKGITRDIAAEALADVDEKEYAEILAAVIKSKARTLDDASTYEGRTRLFRFAASRGFEPELISRTIRELKL